jgi:hypothetical protein
MQFVLLVYESPEAEQSGKYIHRIGDDYSGPFWDGTGTLEPEEANSCHSKVKGRIDIIFANAGVGGLPRLRARCIVARDRPL